MKRLDAKAYNAIKMKIAEEKQEIELEISILQVKKTENQKLKENELNKIAHVRKVFEQQKTVKAGMLHQTYRFDIVKKAEKEIDILDRFIANQNIELDKIKEKEKEVDRIFQLMLFEIKKKEALKEEIILMEYKKLKNKPNRY